jgi:hypothetical protein
MLAITPDSMFTRQYFFLSITKASVVLIIVVLFYVFVIKITTSIASFKTTTKGKGMGFYICAIMLC